MSGFTDTLRGDGLVRVHRALDGLETDSLGLDRARRRFSQPPPPYTSNPGTPTRSTSPELPTDEQRRREQQEQRFQQRRKLVDERAASLPLQQFEAQVDEEKKRIWNANPRTNWMDESHIPIAGTEEKQAIETIKKRWVEQGIWKDSWDEMAAGRGYMDVGRWKHEEPLELESESETDTDAESPPLTFSIFGVPQKPSQLKPRRPKSDDEKRRISERRVIREREREASRPYHQFIYQISKERERIQEDSANAEGADINTRAYENVKNTWTKRGIWSGRWGILPGMSWRHEEPLEEEEEEAADNPAPIPTNPVVNGSHEAGVAPPRRIFGSLSPVASNHRQVPGIMNTSQQGPSTDVDSTRLENDDAVRSPSNSPRSRTGKQVVRPTTGRALRPSRKQPSHKDGQSQRVASVSLGPIHSSKVSKATGNKRPGPQRQPNASQGASSSGIPPLLSSTDIAEPLPQTGSIHPRRSKRLQPPVSIVAKGSTEIAASTDSVKGRAPSRTKPKVPGNPISMVSAKPQRTSKRQQSNTRQEKTRKNGN